MKFKNKLLILSIAAVSFSASFNAKTYVEAAPRPENATTNKGNEHKTDVNDANDANNESNPKTTNKGNKPEQNNNSTTENDEEKTTNLNINEIIEPKETETDKPEPNNNSITEGNKNEIIESKKVEAETDKPEPNNNSNTKNNKNEEDTANDEYTELLNELMGSNIKITHKTNETEINSTIKNDEGKKTQPTNTKEAETEINSIAENDEEKTTSLNINEIIEPKEAETEHKTNETNKPEIIKYKSPNINIIKEVILKNNNSFLLSEKYENEIEEIFNSIINYENSTKGMKTIFKYINVLRKKFKILSQTALLKRALIYLAADSNNDFIIKKHFEMYKEIVNKHIKPTIEFLFFLEKLPVGMVIKILKERLITDYYRDVVFALEKVRSNKYDFFTNEKDIKTYLKDNAAIHINFKQTDGHHQNVTLNYFSNYFNIDPKEKNDFQSEIENNEAEAKAKKFIEETEKDINKFKQILESDKEELKNLGIKAEKEPNQNDTDTAPLKFELNIEEKDIKLELENLKTCKDSLKTAYLKEPKTEMNELNIQKLEENMNEIKESLSNKANYMNESSPIASLITKTIKECENEVNKAKNKYILNRSNYIRYAYEEQELEKLKYPLNKAYLQKPQDEEYINNLESHISDDYIYECNKQELEEVQDLLNKAYLQKPQDEEYINNLKNYINSIKKSLPELQNEEYINNLESHISDDYIYECNKQELEEVQDLLNRAYLQKPQDEEYINNLKNYINLIKKSLPELQIQTQIEILEELIKNSPLNKITNKKTVNTCIEERKKIKEINKEIKEQKLKPEDEKELKKLIEDFNNIITTIEEKEIELIEFKEKTIDYDRLAKELEENKTNSTGILGSNLLLELEKLKKEGKDTTDLAKLLLENLEKRGELIKGFNLLKMQLMILQRTVTAEEKIMETKIRQDKTKKTKIERKLDELRKKTLKRTDTIDNIKELRLEIKDKLENFKRFRNELNHLELIEKPTPSILEEIEFLRKKMRRCTEELRKLEKELEKELKYI